MTRPNCEQCGKTLSVAQAVVAVDPERGDGTNRAHVYCVHCCVSDTLALDDEESVSVSVDLLKRLVDGVF